MNRVVLTVARLLLNIRQVYNAVSQRIEGEFRHLCMSVRAGGGSTGKDVCAPLDLDGRIFYRKTSIIDGLFHCVYSLFPLKFWLRLSSHRRWGFQVR